MYASEHAEAVGIRRRINLHRDSRSFQLGRHFLEIPDSEVQHPNFGGISEVAARFLERSERGGSGLLLPGRFLAARWYGRDSQVLLVPKRQRFRILGSKEKSADSRYFFHFRSSSD